MKTRVRTKTKKLHRREEAELIARAKKNVLEDIALLMACADRRIAASGLRTQYLASCEHGFLSNALEAVKLTEAAR